MVYERALVKGHILTNSPENPKKEIMDRAKSGLRPIVQNRDHPSLSLQIWNSHEPPD
jgi:hypothetical protein